MRGYNIDITLGVSIEFSWTDIIALHENEKRTHNLYPAKVLKILTVKLHNYWRKALQIYLH